MNPGPQPLIRLPDVRLLSVSGPDATDFLQAQLSRRVDNLGPELSAIAGWHDASGKVRAVFRVIETDDGYLLSLPAGLADQLTAALKMFVLRADVTVDLTDHVCAGLVMAGSDTPPGSREGSRGGALPALPTRINAVTQNDGVFAICVAADCWHIVGPENALPALTERDSDEIKAAEIRAGLPQVDPATTQRYVAQMLNLDKLDAIDFEKGCYPGQEVIARTEHLGSVKRRAQLFTLSADVAPADIPGSNTPLVNSSDERVGEVLRCARETDGSIALLGVVALTALSDQVFVEHSRGPALTHHLLPFLADQ